jgi:uncharacterized protein
MQLYPFRDVGRSPASVRTMRTRPFLALLLVLAIPRQRAAAQPGTDAGKPVTITTNVTRSAHLVPDRSVLFVVVETPAATAAEAATRLAQTERAVLDAMQGAGLAADQLHPTGYGVLPTHPPRPAGTSAEPGAMLYTGRTAIRVDLRQPEQIRIVTAAAAGAGATLVGEPRFVYTRADSVRQALLAQAMDEARREAAAMAVAAGGRLGRLLSVGMTPMYDPPQTQPFLPFDMPYATSPHPAPDLLVTVQASVTWELLMPSS